MAALTNLRDACSVHTHGAKFHDIIGEDLVPAQMKEKVDAAKRANEATLSATDQARQTHKNEQVRLETESQSLQDSITSMEQECIAVERDIKTTLDDAHYSSLEEAVKDAKSEIEIRENFLRTAEHQEDFYQSLLTHQEKKNVCRGCNRGFEDGEVPAFQKYVCPRRVFL